METVIVEIKIQANGHCGYCENIIYCVIKGSRTGRKIRKVIKEDILEVLEHLAYKEDKERLLPLIDNMINDLLIKNKKINLNKEAGTTYRIVKRKVENLDEELTSYY